MENRRSEDGKVSRRIWEAVEIEARKIRVAKVKRRRRIQRKGIL